MYYPRKLKSDLKITGLIPVVLLATTLFCMGCNTPGKPRIERELSEKTTAFYAVEMNGVFCGFREMACRRVLTETGEMNQVTD